MANHTINHSLSKKIKLFFKIANKISTTHPELVVISFHEYFRNLYLVDPYIKKRNHKDLKKNLEIIVTNLINFLYFGKKLGSYLSYKKNKPFREDVDTGELFGTLWQDRMNNKSLNSSPILKGLFKRANFNIKKLKNKIVLDMGCGSGRFTSSLANLGVKKAFGVDKGRAGLKIAKIYAKKNKIKNLQYKHASVLNLPFKNEKFDFVFCKGVLHHTGNLKKGLNEFYRVMKKNGEGFLYLYGSGGIFWNSRKLMRNVMKKIPYKKAFKILKTIEMPARRTIFLDSWYVEIEEHVNKKFLENWFNKKKLKFFKYDNPLKTELEYMEKYKYFKEMYGSGELRYFVQK
jgi:ubiquinone/menaquinone biosynthesis C-methylase UbiE